MFSQEIIRIFFLKLLVDLCALTAPHTQERPGTHSLDVIAARAQKKIVGTRRTGAWEPVLWCFHSATTFIFVLSLRNWWIHYAATPALGILQQPWQKMYIYYIVTELSCAYCLLPTRGKMTDLFSPARFLRRDGALLISQAQYCNNCKVKGWSSNMP